MHLLRGDSFNYDSKLSSNLNTFFFLGYKVLHINNFNLHYIALG